MSFLFKTRSVLIINLYRHYMLKPSCTCICHANFHFKPCIFQLHVYFVAEENMPLWLIGDCKLRNTCKSLFDLILSNCTICYVFNEISYSTFWDLSDIPNQNIRHSLDKLSSFLNKLQDVNEFVVFLFVVFCFVFFLLLVFLFRNVIYHCSWNFQSISKWLNK